MRMPASPTSEHLALAERPTPREFPAVSVSGHPPHASHASRAAHASPVPHSLEPRGANGSIEAELRLLAMRVACLVRRVDELGQENEALRAEVSMLARKARPSAPYSSVAPTSEVVRIPDSKRIESKRPSTKPDAAK